MTSTVAAVLVLALWSAAEEPREVATVSDEEPAHKVLFESGFYAEALEYLDGRIESADSSEWQEYQKYRAFCLILTGQRERADTVFCSMLDRDSSFALDPLMTSPKIYEVYFAAKQSWRARNPFPADAARGDTLSADSARGPADSSSAGAGRTAAVERGDTAAGDEWYRVPLYFLPGASGQFYNRDVKKAVPLLAVQTLGLVGSIVTYAARSSHYHDDYGWYEGNAREYENYTTAYRVEFSVFLVSYVYSVVDAFVSHRRRERTGATEVAVRR
jgi:hypothetical protein